MRDDRLRALKQVARRVPVDGVAAASPLGKSLEAMDFFDVLRVLLEDDTDGRTPSAAAQMLREQKAAFLRGSNYPSALLPPLRETRDVHRRALQRLFARIAEDLMEDRARIRGAVGVILKEVRGFDAPPDWSLEGLRAAWWVLRAGGVPVASALVAPQDTSPDRRHALVWAPNPHLDLSGWWVPTVVTARLHARARLRESRGC